MRKTVILLMFAIISCGGIDTGTTKDQESPIDFPNENAGLFWSDRSFAPMKWDAAVVYCEDLGGMLPTISELRTLIINCSLTETGGPCGITDDCLIYNDCWTMDCDGYAKQEEIVGYSVFDDKQKLWSSSEMTGNEYNTWNVDFANGLVGYANMGNLLYVRCVK